MELHTLVAPVLQTNCYLLAEDGACLVVDPGAGAALQVRRRVAAGGWSVVGILVTHGHADHVWDAGALADELGLPVHVPAADAYRLADPVGVLGRGDPRLTDAFQHAVAQVGAPDYRVPDRVVTFGEPGPGRAPDVRLTFGPIRLLARHAPGHTEGSTLYLVDVDGPVALTGDVLFARGVGRTDLPGGDLVAMAATLRDVVEVLDPATRALPGHGPATVVSAELAHNPWLRGRSPLV